MLKDSKNKSSFRRQSKQKKVKQSSQVNRRPKKARLKHKKLKKKLREGVVLV